MEFLVLKRWRVTFADKNLFILVGLPIIIFTQNAACFSYLCGVVVLCCYLMGIYCCRCVTRNLSSPSSFVKSVLPVADSDLTISSKHGQVSGGIFTSRSIDRALDQLLCRIVDQYVSTWYANISSDAWFQFEIRSAIRRIVCDLYCRIARINLERFVLDKVLPICLAHADAVAVGRNLEIERLHVAVHSRKSEVLYVQNLSKCILKYLLPTCDLNCKSYAILLREIVSKSVILSLSDAICNPCVLNRLILRYLEMDETIFPNDDNDQHNGSDVDSDSDNDSNTDTGEIRLLCKFSDPCQSASASYNGSLRPDVSSILKDKELQNTFMRFLKSHNAEHVLQFCLDIASFNEKILKPELEAEELDNLYRDAWDLFSVYFSRYSPNCIDFHKDLASPLRKALSKDILKLRTTATLFEAYECAFSILENHCQEFHNSAEFYRWLYGRCDAQDAATYAENNLSLPTHPHPPLSTSTSLSSTSTLPCLTTATVRESFGRKTIAEIGQKFSKIKEALKTESVLDGRLYGGGGDFSSRAIAIETAQELLCTEVGVDVPQLATVRVADSKNVNAWRISVPSTSWRTDPITDATYEVLVIRITNENGVEWLVERRPIDVHSLNAKLIALDDKMLDDFHLPTLESSSSSLENVQMYEEYLKKLLERVELGDSPLLYDFFTSAAAAPINAAERTMIGDDDDDDSGGDIDDVVDDEDDDYENEESSIGKIFRESVVPTLKRERGQNLETFVSSLISSCAATKHEYKDVGLVGGERKSFNKKTQFNLKSSQLYGNNFDVDANRTRETVLSSKFANANCANRARLTPFSVVIHVAHKIYNLRTEFVRMLLCLKSTFGTLADRCIFKLTSSRLNSITNERNVAYFLNTVEWAVFDNKTKYNQHLIRNRVTKLLTDMNDHWLYPVYQLIFQTIQDAKKNKQFFYNLCDAVMEELFSEIFTPIPE